jgi:hypothetical protein
VNCGRIARPAAIVVAWLAVSGAHAQSHWSKVPVPVYTPTHFVQGIYRYWAAPQAADFATRSAALTPAVQALCDAPPRDAAAGLATARSAWRASAVSWDRLSAVAIGPLIARRSQRQIDFTPTRPALIAKAIDEAPTDAVSMERIGTPAKGLPALEWLLWKQPLPSGSAACGYAVQVAADIEREAAALAVAFGQAADRAWDDEPAAVAAMSEIVNQWVGGVERLGWGQLDKPVRSAESGKPAYPRGESGGSAASWAAQWQSLRSLGVFGAAPSNARRQATRGGPGNPAAARHFVDGPDVAPAPGAALVPLESYLRGRGSNTVADALVQASARVDVAISALSADASRPPVVSRVLAASARLNTLKQLAENDLAPALDVSIGFSDADGD